MAIIGSSFLDIIDVMKRSDSDDALRVGLIIEMLKENNAFLEDALTMKANMGTRHRTTLRTKLPDGDWGKLYKGIPGSKSETSQIEDTTGFFEALSTIDTRLLKLGDEGSLRLSEAKGFLETVSQNVASALVYANEDLDPEQFTGFTPRFNSATGQTGGQIVNAGGTASINTSAWFVTWGDEQCHMIYPDGTAAGVVREDKGEQRVVDAAGDPYFAKEELFTQHAGLTVRDYRQVARVANIDTDALAAGTVDIYKFFRNAFWKIRKHRVTGAREAIYCNAEVLEALDADSTPTTSTSASFARLKPMEVDGFEVMSYRGIPVRQTDAILNTEETVVFP